MFALVTASPHPATRQTWKLTGNLATLLTFLHWPMPGLMCAVYAAILGRRRKKKTPPRTDEKEMIDIHVVCHLHNIKLFWDGRRKNILSRYRHSSSEIYSLKRETVFKSLRKSKVVILLVFKCIKYLNCSFEFRSPRSPEANQLNLLQSYVHLHPHQRAPEPKTRPEDLHVAVIGKFLFIWNFVRF